MSGDSRPTFGSLFAGIGGFDLGFERAGMRCVWQVEIDEYARRVLTKHWPGVPKHDDIKTFTGEQWERPDVICGGFPCQDISYAGKGAGLAGERSGLFYEAMRVVREMGPRVVVLENVAALLTRGMGDVLGTLASLGYDAEWHCIPAAAVGAPHFRDRVILLAINTNSQHDGSLRASQKFKSKTAASRSRSKQMAYTQSNRWKQGKSHYVGSIEGVRAWKEYRPDSGDRWWKTEPAVGRVADGVPNRVHRLRGLGNAVVPQVAEFVGRQVVASLRNEL